MKRFRQPAIRMALIPGLVEAFFDGGLGVALFGMPVRVCCWKGRVGVEKASWHAGEAVALLE